MSRSAIESGPAGHRLGSWEDDEPGDTCSLCLGHGDIENPYTGADYTCPACDGAGVAP